MVDDLKGKKRKGAADATPKPKKQKKSDPAAAVKSASKALKAAVEPIDSVPFNVKPSRKRSEDVLENGVDAKSDNKKNKTKRKSNAKAEELESEANGVVPNSDALESTKAHKRKRGEKVAAEAEVEVEAPKAKSKKVKKAEDAVAPEEGSSKMAKKAKKQKVEAKEPVPDVEAGVDTDSDDEEVEDDQTAALLAGFESDRDEEDSEDESFSETARPAISEDLRLELVKASKNKSDERGVLYIGRIPHGFFEPQMKAYFSQFGKITRLRLSRNKKTGNSKHYAFIEFESAEVADIVAKTMNKYLLFGHILQCSVIPPEQVRENLFKGANQRFKHHPRNKMVGSEMARGAERDVWEKRVAREKKSRDLKNKKLKETIGYEFTAPALKSVKDVPTQLSALDGPTKQLAIEAPADEVANLPLITESKPDEESVVETTKTKKQKKGKKGKADVDVATINATEEAEPVKEKKDKKAKAKDKAEQVAEVEVQEPEIEPVKSKKSKKAAKSDAVVAPATEEKKRKAKVGDDESGKGKKARKSKA